ncbi:MAG: hypothetical protein OIF34_02160, partial [Porticoccaceae bacterium]|nr:hypothetical protein [Porticoccaceae bacterium]
RSALVGLMLALVAVVLSMITGNPVYDACGSIAIGVLLIVIAILIGREVKALLVGQGVDPQVKQSMRDWLEQRDEVASVYNLLTLQMGNDVMVAVKARLSPVDAAEQLVGAINCCERDFRDAFPQVQWLFFEPDNKD